MTARNPSTTWTLRPATAVDARSVADVYLRSRHAAFPLIPRSVHPDDEVRDWFAEVVLPRGGVWVAEAADGHVVGMMALDDDWIDHLYVDPPWVDQGLGTAFVTLAKRERPHGLQLWAFQSNEPARRFYERQGFVAVEVTDGSANEEQAPDVRYAWPDATSGPAALPLVDLATMVNDEYLLLDGLRLHVREWPGPSPDAPVIVLLHGFTGHARTWDRSAAALTDRYGVLCPDARGHGESAWDPSGEYGVDRQVADVVGLLGALGLSRVTVLGLSMGGRTAFNLAANRPELVERLVVVDIGPQVSPAGAARIGASVGAPDRFATPDDALAQARAGNAVAPDDVLRHRVRHNLLLLEDGTWTWRYDPALRAGGASALPRPDVAQQWALLPRITAPTLLVRGELSDVLSPEDAQRMTQEIPDCEMVEVPGAGHSVPLDRPDGFLDAIRPFLSV